jgi:hypothetical protein
MPKQVKISREFQGTSHETFALVFGEELTREYQASQGNTNVEIAPWSAPDETGQRHRTVKYVIPMNVPIPTAITKTVGLVDTMCTTTEHVQEVDGIYIITSSCDISGAPGVSSTKVVPFSTIKPNPSGKGSILDVVITCEFTGGYGLTSVVETTMESGVKKGFADFLDLASQKEAAQRK